MPKNWLLPTVIVLVVLWYMSDSYVSKVDEVFRGIKSDTVAIKGELISIAQKVDADKNVTLNNYKLQMNLDVLSGTGCISCHNTTDMALPIYKRTVNEAMRIVREGTQSSIQGGMPLYSPRNTRDRTSITDSDLRVRLDRLYINEFLVNVPSPRYNK